MNSIPSSHPPTGGDAHRGQNLVDLRGVNLNVLLSAIWENAPISRVSLSEVTGLAPSSITRLIRHLSSQGLIIETGKGQSSGGRQPILIAPNPGAGIILSLDLSGSQIRGGVFDAANQGIRQVESPFDGLGPENIGRQIFALADELLRDQPLGERPLLGIGVSSPGVVSGEVVSNHTLKLHHFPLQTLLEERYHVPVLVQNDSRVAALTEKYYGAGRQVDDFIYVLLSDGIGAGLILNGELYNGPLEIAGEIGHTIVDRSGTFCSCGRRGCLETVATRAAILSHTQRILAYDHDVILTQLAGNDPERLTLALLRTAAEQGSRAAIQVFEYAADHVSLAIVNAAAIAGVSVVIVGGDVAQQLGSRYFEALTTSVQRYNQNFQPLRLIQAELDWKAFLRGISMLTLQRIIGIDL